MRLLPEGSSYCHLILDDKLIVTLPFRRRRHHLGDWQTIDWIDKLNGKIFTKEGKKWFQFFKAFYLYFLLRGSMSINGRSASIAGCESSRANTK